MSSARGEFHEAAEELARVLGSFGFVTASLREAVTSLRMTELASLSRAPAGSILREIRVGLYFFNLLGVAFGVG